MLCSVYYALPSPTSYRGNRGWQAWLFPVQVGCRGFPAQSEWNTVTAFGITGRDKKAAIHRLEEAAERALIVALTGNS